MPSPRKIDHAARLLAATQHGLLSVQQLADLGATRGWRRHQIARGALIPLSPRVLRVGGAPDSPSQMLMAAVLDAADGAAVSHVAAAVHWGLPGFPVRRPEVTTERARSVARSTLATVHRPRFDIHPFSILIDGVPTVRPSVLLLQLAPSVSGDRLARIFDWFWSRRLLTGVSIRRDLTPLLGRGRPGSTVLRELLDARPDDHVAPTSNLEARFESVLAQQCLPPMRRQVDLGDDGWRGRVDYLARDLPLVVEIDSDLHHSSISDTEADLARQARLEDAGFTVARVAERLVWHDPDAVGQIVREGRRRATARMTSVA